MNNERNTAPLALDPELLAYGYELTVRAVETAETACDLLGVHVDDLDTELPRGAREAAVGLAQEQRQRASAALNAADRLVEDGMRDDASFGPLVDRLDVARETFWACCAVLGIERKAVALWPCTPSPPPSRSATSSVSCAPSRRLATRPPAPAPSWPLWSAPRLTSTRSRPTWPLIQGPTLLHRTRCGSPA